MRNVVIGFLGTKLDGARKAKWRPTPSLVAHEEFEVDRIEILYDHRFSRIAHNVARETQEASPHTEVLLQRLDLDDPWDFQEVYGKLFDFAQGYGFDEDRERYHVHLTTGTHVAQICWFLLTESRHVPARLLQTGPPGFGNEIPKLDVIDLDLSRYDALQSRFDALAREHGDLLRGGIETRSASYNALIDRIETVAGASDAPILLTGESGTGKTELARRIYELKLNRRRVKGRLVQVNCATLRGEGAAASLFGQRRQGAAGTERSGLLREADGGVLFLDEIDALGPGEQSLLLHAIETGRYYPIGSDHEVTSRFQVIAGAGCDLAALAAEGRFRTDLLSRLDLWRFELPPLRERPEDIEPNLRHEMEAAERRLGQRFGFMAGAAEAYLRFARDPGSAWPANFRDLSGSVQRMCTLAPRGRITRAMVDEECARLSARWRAADPDPDGRLLRELLPGADLDPFDAVQLAGAIRACRRAPSLSAAGRALFAVSRARRSSTNDADRLRKYLARFGLDWESVTLPKG